MKMNVLLIYIYKITMINIKYILRTESNLFQQAACYMISFLFFFFQKNFIKVQLTYNVFISAIWQNACYIYIHIYYFHYDISQDVKYSSLYLHFYDIMKKTEQ